MGTAKTNTTTLSIKKGRKFYLMELKNWARKLLLPVAMGTIAGVWGKHWQREL
jgi:hypothetical protein